MNFGNIDYASNAVPANYRCQGCGAHGCKLWREYQTCANQSELVCCDCAGKSQGKDVSRIDAEGKRPLHNDADRPRTDSIGWRVPAVPTEDGATYWGYTSVPDAAVAWWKRLPTRAREPN